MSAESAARDALPPLRVWLSHAFWFVFAALMGWVVGRRGWGALVPGWQPVVIIVVFLVYHFLMERRYSRKRDES